ncbi:hypothetical protein K443DRAFT_684941, partial [Laccaria amethystina LaAM-08-1]
MFPLSPTFGAPDHASYGSPRVSARQTILTTSSWCGGEASHEAVGLWPSCSITGM